jgi:arylesterase/paraoxonase
LLNFRTYYDTVSHPLLKSLNDVTPIGFRAFYATNDHTVRNNGLKMASDVAGVCNGNIVFLDYPNNQTEVAVDNLCFPNSPFLSPNRKFLYYTETMTGVLHVARRYNNGTISPFLAIPMDTLVDNIHINPDMPNELWIASHPNGPAFMKHALMGGLSPSQVLKVTFKSDSPKQVDLKKDSKYDIKEFFQSDGSDISGSSVAAEWGGKIVIGSVFDNHILVCDVNK